VCSHVQPPRAQQNKVLRRIDAGVTYSTEDEARERKRKRI
jgi:hypothetical protein